MWGESQSGQMGLKELFECSKSREKAQSSSAGFRSILQSFCLFLSSVNVFVLSVQESLRKSGRSHRNGLDVLGGKDERFQHRP